MATTRTRGFGCLFLLNFFFNILYTNHANWPDECETATIEIGSVDGTKQRINLSHLQTLKQCDSCLKFTETNSETFHYLLRFAADERLRTKIYMKELKDILSELILECESNEKPADFGICYRLVWSQPFQHNISQKIEVAVNVILSRRLLSHPIGDPLADRKLATAIVLINLDYFEEALNLLNDISRTLPKEIGVLLARGHLYIRQGLEDKHNLADSLLDFTTAIELWPDLWEGYLRRGELFSLMGHPLEAIIDFSKAISINSSAKLYMRRGWSHFQAEQYVQAESDLRKALRLNGSPEVQRLLGLSLLYQGKIRNAIEIYKDSIKSFPRSAKNWDHLGQAYKELGFFSQAKESFDKSISLDPGNSITYLNRGSLFLAAGEILKAISDFKSCVILNSQQGKCLYLLGIALITAGQYFEGIKALAKFTIQQQVSSYQMNAEIIKVQYIREFARYQHAHLDDAFRNLQTEKDLHAEFKDRWIKTLPFTLENHKDQPGLQPHISDVSLDYPLTTFALRTLLCYAEKLGELTQVTSDGFLPNKRLNLAMGLAALDLAQTLENYWRTIFISKTRNKRWSWQTLINIPVHYRRIVMLDLPVFWISEMPKKSIEEGYSNVLLFQSQEKEYVQNMPYYEIAFKLMKTSIQFYRSQELNDYPEFLQDLERASNCNELLEVIKKRRINQLGFRINTQIPSIKNKTKVQYDGTTIILSELQGILFFINTALTKHRTEQFKAELDFLFNKLSDEISRKGSDKLEPEVVSSLVLSFMYYMLNLMPLTKGTSAIAYTAAIAIFMSLGYEITGKIPQGKLLLLEAIFAGEAELFNFSTQQWMKIRKQNKLQSLPRVSEVLPSLRSVIEVLNHIPKGC